MSQGEPLPYEQFQWREEGEGSNLDNYIAFFGSGGMAEEMRKHSSFRQFQVKHPDVARRLLDGIPKTKPWTAQRVEPYREDLYKAYVFMRDFFKRDEDMGVIRP